MKSKRNVTGEELRGGAMQLVGVYDMSIYLQDASSECAVQCQEKGTQKATLSQRQRDRPGGEMRHTHIFPQGPKPLGAESTSRLGNTDGC